MINPNKTIHPMLEGFKYSVAIPTKDRPEELMRCLKCVLAQSIRPEKIIIVDDGNLDIRIIEEVLISDKDIQKSGFAFNKNDLVYLKKDKPGLIESLNIAADLCQTDWILLLDDDIFINNNFMDKMLEVLQTYKNPEHLAAISGTATILGDKGKTIRTKIRLMAERFFLINGGYDGRFFPSGFSTDYTYGYHPNRPFKVEHVPGGLSLWRTQILRKYRFDKAYTGYGLGCDMDLSYRVSRDYDTICHPYANAIHAKSQRSRISKRTFGEMRIRNRFYFYRTSFRKTLFTHICFSWAIFGMLVISFFSSVFSRNNIERLEEFKGMMSALWKEVFKR